MTWRVAAAAAVAAVATALAPGCADRSPAPSGASPGRAATPAASSTVREYVVRGELVRLPGPGAPLREITVRHEAIPGFVGQDGRVVGMPAMVMPLEVAPGVPLEGLRPGDKVELLLAVDWERSSYAVRRVKSLPAGTVLDLGSTR